MRHRLFLHIVWTTRDRAPALDRARAEFLVSCLPDLALRERCRIMAIGIVRTHLHLLVRQHPSANIPRLLQFMKGSSATFARRDHALPITWARGYNIESVSVRALPDVRYYVNHQADHHPIDAIPGFVVPEEFGRVRVACGARG